MDFALTTDQAVIRDTAASFLADASSPARLRTVLASAEAYDRRLWSQIGRELGWCATAIPEAYGGVGLSWIELTLLMEQCGRRLVWAPFFSTAGIVAPTLLEIGNETACQRFLPPIASGELSATVALGTSTMDWRPNQLNVIARRDRTDYVLEGSYRYVPDGGSAELLLLPARLEDGGLGLFAVPAETPSMTRKVHECFDATRRTAEVSLGGLRLPGDALIGRDRHLDEAMRRAVALAAIALAAEQLGGAQQCLDMTLAYTAERKQFGRSVASFQAVKHRCAEMMVRIEACRSAVYGAARVAAVRPDTETLVLEAACAKSIASDAYFYCAQEAIQLHGGVGFTWEYDIHFYFKRAQATGHWFGTADDLRERIACALLDLN